MLLFCLQRLVGMMVALILGIWGDNPFDPDGIFWGKQPQNNLLLWISIAIFLVTTILWYIVWFLLRAEVAGHNRPRDKEARSLWYEAGNTIQMNRLVYMVLFPGLCITQVFRNVAAISGFGVFSWLEMGALLVTFVVDIIRVILIATNVYRLRQEREKRR